MFTLQQELPKKFHENLKLSDLPIRPNFLTMISISLFCCCEKVFTCMNTWMIGEKSIKHHCDIFTVT